MSLELDRMGFFICVAGAGINVAAYLLDGLLFNFWLSGMCTGMALIFAIEIIVE